MAGRTMVKMLTADDFFPEGDVEKLRDCISASNFVPCAYGQELHNFNMIYPDIEVIFRNVLGERVTVDQKTSGVFRKPYNNAIHYEACQSLDEWCFFIALEKTVVNFWHHIDPDSIGDLQVSEERDARAGVDYNFKNLFEWKIHTNITLEPNQGLFFRPWLFHSLESGLVQYYRLTADPKYRVLVMGLPGSSKRSIAEKLHERIPDSNLLHSIDIREQKQDLNFDEDGQMRQCHRLLRMARQSDSQVTIVNMTTPIPRMREILNPDFLILVDGGDLESYEDLKELYEAPEVYDYKLTDDSDEEIENIIKRIQTKRI